MTPPFQIIYILVLLALSGISLYLYTLARSLSLPLSPVLSLLTTLLPIISPLATFFPQINPILSFVATILLTLQSSNLFATPPCLLESTWRQRYSAHDADRIRKIQDSLNCCGYRNVKDMAWPFPHKGVLKSPCGEQFGRTEGCMIKWEGVLKSVSGGEVGIVLAVVLVQILVMVLRKRGGSGWWEKWVGSRGDRGFGSRERRGLLTGADVEDDEQVGNGNGNGRYSDGGRVTEGDEEQPGQRRVEEGYGGTEGGGPRVEALNYQRGGPWDDERD
ncbi:hypothetical protein QBC43DRAFT_370419 [Cladorrhinum sp. PSN259]|nr:hypothetical protein QBC43DRAFT_370419 [Cladorrhinum sp. PSN259]